jgi:hypothetical protein
VTRSGAAVMVGHCHEPKTDARRPHRNVYRSIARHLNRGEPYHPGSRKPWRTCCAKSNATDLANFRTCGDAMSCDDLADQRPNPWEKGIVHELQKKRIEAKCPPD